MRNKDAAKTKKRLSDVTNIFYKELSSHQKQYLTAIVDIDEFRTSISKKLEWGEIEAVNFQRTSLSLNTSVTTPFNIAAAMNLMFIITMANRCSKNMFTTRINRTSDKADLFFYEQTEWRDHDHPLV
ncbi:hypothetical protein BDF21DRAFT_393983 [Thamnidium elegans]|nr:hypothetical protein BDF21DRAFT_393983 [Thamnidium elegans]